MKNARLQAALFYALATIPLAALFYVMFSRLAFPFEVEWMEGGMITHAARTLQGLPIYAEPRVDFVAYFYAPLYSYALAALSFLTGGLSFALARGVSVAATLGILGLLYTIGKREANAATGVLAAGLYAAHFRMAGAFFDLARPDSFALFLLLASFFAIRYFDTRKGLIAAVALAVAAFFAKQTMAVFVPAIALGVFLENKKRALIYAGSAIVLGLAIGELCDVLQDGWFRFYIVEGHQGHEFLWKNFVREYWRDVFFLSPLLLTIPVIALAWDRVLRFLLLLGLPILVIAIKARLGEIEFGPHMYYDELFYGDDRPKILIAPLATLALVAFAGLARGKSDPLPRAFIFFWGASALASALNHSTQWAYSNCFMPIALGSSLLLALTMARVVHVDDATLRTRIGAVVGTLALIVGFVPLAYDPAKQVPDTTDAQAVAQLRAELAPLGDNLWIPAHPFFTVENGGRIYAHQMGLGDVAFGGGLRDLDERLAQKEWDAIVLDNGAHIPGLEVHYRRTRALRWESGDAIMPRTGYRSRPEWIWTPRR